MDALGCDTSSMFTLNERALLWGCICKIVAPTLLSISILVVGLT